MQKDIFSVLPFYVRQFNKEQSSQIIKYGPNNHIWIRIMKKELNDDLLTINLYLDFIDNNDENILYLESDMFKEGYGDDENKNNWKEEFEFDTREDLYLSIGSLINKLKSSNVEIIDDDHLKNKIEKNM